MRKSDRLRKLLHYWELREAAKRMEVAEAIRGLAEAKEQERSAREALHELLEGRSSGERDLAWVPYETQAAEGLVSALDDFVQKISEAESKVGQRQEELRSVAGRRTGMEKLTESKEREERKASDKRDQKLAEELYRAFRLKR